MMVLLPQSPLRRLLYIQFRIIKKKYGFTHLYQQGTMLEVYMNYILKASKTVVYNIFIAFIFIKLK